MPYWEDDEPRMSPDGATVAYVDDGHIWLVPAAGGPPRRLVEGASPVWTDATKLVVAAERGDATRLAVVGVTDAWPRRLAAAPSGGEKGDESQAAVSPDGREVAYVFHPRDDLNRAEIRVADVATGAVRALTGTPRMQDRGPQWSPDGATIVFASERPGWYEVHAVDSRGGPDRQLTHDGADFAEVSWHPDDDRLAAIRTRRGRSDLVVVDAASGTVEPVASDGTWGSPHWTADGDIVATYEDHATPAPDRVDRHGDRRRVLAHRTLAPVVVAALVTEPRLDIGGRPRHPIHPRLAPAVADDGRVRRLGGEREHRRGPGQHVGRQHAAADLVHVIGVAVVARAHGDDRAQLRRAVRSDLQAVEAAPRDAEQPDPPGAPRLVGEPHEALEGVLLLPGQVLVVEDPVRVAGPRRSTRTAA
jgi:dipeptidyl aminopeptidase/acylaminoacyl peptidase